MGEEFVVLQRWLMNFTTQISLLLAMIACVDHCFKCSWQALVSLLLKIATSNSFVNEIKIIEVVISTMI